jgi:hypothetical protein
LVENRPSWLEFDPWLLFCAPIWTKFGQFGKFSATSGVISAKTGGGIQTETEIRPITGFLCADSSEVQLVWKMFGQILRKSGQNCGRIAIVCIRPFLNEFRPF